MTTRYVPSVYTTIQAAVNACVSGDVVEVNGGTYTETVTHASTTNIMLRAAYGTRVAFTGRITCRSGWSVRGFDFTYATLTSSDFCFGSSSLGRFSIVDCTFTISGTGYGLRFGAASMTNIIRRCRFTNNSLSTGGRAIYASAGIVYIESCIFKNYRNSSDGLIRIASTGTNQHSWIYNCVFHTCQSSSGYIIRIDGTATGNKTVANCIFHTCTYTTGLILISAGTRNVANCCHYNNTNSTLVNAGPTDLGGHVTADPLFVDTTDFYLQETSPCLEAGNLTYWAPKDYYGRALTDLTAPDIGAVRNYYDVKNCLFIKYKLVDIGNGITITISTGGNVPNTKRSFETPWEIIDYIEHYLHENINFVQGGFQITWEVSNKYRFTALSSFTYNLVNSVFGSGSGTTTDTE